MTHEEMVHSVTLPDLNIDSNNSQLRWTSDSQCDPKWGLGLTLPPVKRRRLSSQTPSSTNRRSLYNLPPPQTITLLPPNSATSTASSTSATNTSSVIPIVNSSTSQDGATSSQDIHPSGYWLRKRSVSTILETSTTNDSTTSQSLSNNTNAFVCPRSPRRSSTNASRRSLRRSRPAQQNTSSSNNMNNNNSTSTASILSQDTVAVSSSNENTMTIVNNNQGSHQSTVVPCESQTEQKFVPTTCPPPLMRRHVSLPETTTISSSNLYNNTHTSMGQSSTSSSSTSSMPVIDPSTSSNNNIMDSYSAAGVMAAAATSSLLHHTSSHPHFAHFSPPITAPYLNAARVALGLNDPPQANSNMVQQPTQQQQHAPSQAAVHALPTVYPFYPVWFTHPFGSGTEVNNTPNASSTPTVGHAHHHTAHQHAHHHQLLSAAMDSLYMRQYSQAVFAYNSYSIATAPPGPYTPLTPYLMAPMAAFAANMTPAMFLNGNANTILTAPPNTVLPPGTHPHAAHAAALMMVRRRGLSRSELDSLTCQRYNIKQEETDEETIVSEPLKCMVCLDDVENDQIIRRLRCNHRFHSKCVDKWLRGNRTCPICRRDAHTGKAQDRVNI